MVITTTWEIFIDEISTVASLSQAELDRSSLQNEFMHIRTSQIPAGRLHPYRTGHGDFVFLDEGDRLARKKPPVKESQPENYVETSASDVPFRIMDLPREIRDEIYKAVISPMTERADDFGIIHGFEGASACFVVYSPALVPRWPAGAELTNQEQRQSGLQRCPPRHPARLSPYEISTFLPTSLQEMDDIRSLSNTNSFIRKELAEATWARTSIFLDNHGLLSFMQFLTDRPAVWNGIKQLRLELNFFKDWRRAQVESPLIGFPTFCEMISCMLQLESLILSIKIDQDDIESFFRVNEKPEWVQGLRMLPVSRIFELELKPSPSDYDGDEDFEDFEDRVDDLREEYEKRLKEEICPESLRPREKSLDEMTDVERYMATRIVDPVDLLQRLGQLQ